MNSLDIISVAGAVLQIVSGEDGISLDLITQAAPVVEITTTSLPGRNGTNGTNGADLGGYDPGDLTLIFENQLI